MKILWPNLHVHVNVGNHLEGLEGFFSGGRFGGNVQATTRAGSAPVSSILDRIVAEGLPQPDKRLRTVGAPPDDVPWLWLSLEHLPLC